MKVTIKDRLIIQGVLIPLMPAKGSFIEMIHISNIKEQAQISIEEVKKFNFRDLNNGEITWNDSPECDKVLELSAEQIDLLQLAVYALDEQKLITMDLLNTCEKILKLTESK
ncbi:hypothetical protein G7074_18225 [Pedobacter sp. HDW13]|uniref:hypothetical protein n=1 Tax=Pedobacter sp. HDW13 TaxID=2714940 RepID=UPI0014095DA4|nr:hypothetical protein [Pedobacter sp. HDW13]QIL41031.1 hypothetical protein G7074_18225 [Pedobacter sp. HDW13]